MAVAAGLAHGMALKSDGTVVAWGWNGSGQTSVPPDLRDVVAIEAGRSRCLAVKSDGTVVAWGEPPDVPDGLDNIVAVSTGTCTLAIRASLKISSVTMVEDQPALHFRTFTGREYSAEYGRAMIGTVTVGGQRTAHLIRHQRAAMLAETMAIFARPATVCPWRAPS